MFKLDIGTREEKEIKNKEGKIRKVVTGRTFHTEIDSNIFIGKKINEIIKGEDIDKKFEGYEFKITGASTKEGFPALAEVEGTSVKKLLLKYGKGMRNRRKGLRLRKSVRGNTIAEDISQINLKVVKQGLKPLDEIFRKTEEKKEIEEKREVKKEEKIKNAKK